MMKYVRVISAIAAVVVTVPCWAADTKGAGSTFVSPIMAKWSDAYKAKTGKGISYQSVPASVSA